MPEDDLAAIGVLRQQLRGADRVIADLGRRLGEFESVLRDHGRRLVALEEQRREALRRPVDEPPFRPTEDGG